MLELQNVEKKFLKLNLLTSQRDFHLSQLMWKSTTVGSINKNQWCRLSESWKTSGDPPTWLRIDEAGGSARIIELLTLLCKVSPTPPSPRPRVSEGCSTDPRLNRELFSAAQLFILDTVILCYLKMNMPFISIAIWHLSLRGTRMQK